MTVGLPAIPGGASMAASAAASASLSRSRLNLIGNGGGGGGGGSGSGGGGGGSGGGGDCVPGRQRFLLGGGCGGRAQWQLQKSIDSTSCLIGGGDSGGGGPVLPSRHNSECYHQRIYLHPNNHLYYYAEGEDCDKICEGGVGGNGGVQGCASGRRTQSAYDLRPSSTPQMKWFSVSFFHCLQLTHLTDCMSVCRCSRPTPPPAPRRPRPSSRRSPSTSPSP